MMCGLRIQLQSEFLQILIKLRPGSMSEGPWTKRRQQRAGDQNGAAQSFFTDYYDEINRAWFDLTATVSLLKKHWVHAQANNGMQLPARRARSI
jgi:hypothetical protein